MAKVIKAKFFRSEIIRQKLEALPPQMTEPVRRAMANAGDMVVARAQMLVPKKSGVLRDSITWDYIVQDKRVNVQAIRIGPSGYYLKAHGHVIEMPRYVEFGTAPSTKGQRIIQFKKGGKLRQVGATGRVAVRTTLGSRARPFLFPAWKQCKRKAREMIKDAVNRVLGGAAKGWSKR